MARRKNSAARRGRTRISWSDLEVALSLARAGTLSGAARELAVEHTTVGRRLAALESALDVRLFDRTSTGYVLTESGKSAMAHAKAIEEHAFALERSVTARDARVAGTVRVTALDPFITDFLLPSLSQLTDAHPELTVIACADMRMLSLSRRDADIAIRYGAPKEPDLVGRRLCGVGSSLYGSRAYLKRRGTPRDPRDLSGHDLVGLAPEISDATEERWLAKHGRGARVVVRASSPAVQLAAIRRGLGLGVHACHAADREPGVVRVSDEVLLAEEWWAVVHVDMVRAPRVRAVLDFLSERAAAERERLEGMPPG
jgi:DNA-binding transcriptional LysR family regulator